MMRQLAKVSRRFPPSQRTLESRAQTIPRDRALYSAIVDRPPLVLPDGHCIVVWTIVNLECGHFAAVARQVLPAPGGQVMIPDVPNWAWHEYGMRVGFCGFTSYTVGSAFARPCRSTRACASTIHASPKRAETPDGNSWATVRTRPDSQGRTTGDDRAVARTRSKRLLANGRWDGLGPGLTETYDTPDYLTAAGIKYIGDWVYDDERPRSPRRMGHS